MTVGELLNNMAQKAGIAADNAELKTMLTSPEMANIVVPDTLVTSIENGLLSMEAAKNNHPDIKKVYTAQAYDGMDKHLIQILGSDTFEPADLEEIKNEKSTSKKYEIAISKLKSAKANAKGADKEEINKQIAAAHEAARLAKEEVTKVKSEYEGKIKDIQLTAARKAVYGNYKTIYDEMPGSIKSATMDALIMQALQDNKADFTIDEHGNLQLVGKDGSNVFGANHVVLTTPSFLDKTFAPILKVANTKQPAAKLNGQTQPPAFKVDEAAEATVNQISSHNASVMEQLNKPQASLV